MDIFTGNQLWQGEVAVTSATIGQINAQTGTDVSLTVPAYFNTSHVPYVTVASLDSGLTIGPAWFSAVGVVKVRVANFSSGNITPASTLTFKVVIL